MTQVQTRPHTGIAGHRRTTHGNTARALDWNPAPVRPAPSAPAPRRRTPLSVVPAAVQRRRRAPVVILCFITLILGLGAVLLLNISVSSGQYQLVQLQNERTELAQRNEALTQQLENHQAPQVLAAEAAELGMVTSSSFGSIDLQTLAVTGDPVPAEEADAPAVLIPAPNVLTQPVAPAVPAAEAPAPVVESARAAEEREAAAAESAAAGEGEPEPAPAVQESDLNGGTIPAPVQRSGQ
ncbi:hypothetical protein QMA10_07075 [Arthrobacter sp. APC 3897]|uniref:hypothetical protein n=1 Tax=Arthrobacter sp. APC 3897 TaxID=3035204 RepID=UPI0025B39E70|nr:hypothetical protein [Arthrobacter sp. APC 3897]MDN3481685.1 hypothetical protein [Arthrobacter sp. APC 3897]